MLRDIWEGRSAARDRGRSAVWLDPHSLDLQGRLQPRYSRMGQLSAVSGRGLRSHNLYERSKGISRPRPRYGFKRRTPTAGGDDPLAEISYGTVSFISNYL